MEHNTMSRRITISTFSSVPAPVADSASPEDAVQHVIKHWQAKLAGVLPDRPDLILLPEMGDMPADHPHARADAYLAARGTKVLDYFASVARQHKCHIAYSSIRQDEAGLRRNTMIVLDRAGKLAGSYVKPHVVIDEHENLNVHYGDRDAIIVCDFGRVACVICFDLNFDDARLRIKAAKPDLILFSSMYHGGMMQAYWAYSCRAHFAAALHRMQPSAILSPTGQTLASTTNYFDHVSAQVNLDCGLFHLDNNWPKLEAAKAKYGPKLSLRDPGFLGSVLMSSECDEFTIGDIAREFQLEPLDDYLNRSLAHREAHCRKG
jgi:predicted amidohydrolase